MPNEKNKWLRCETKLTQIFLLRQHKTEIFDEKSLRRFVLVCNEYWFPCALEICTRFNIYYWILDLYEGKLTGNSHTNTLKVLLIWISNEICKITRANSSNHKKTDPIEWSLAPFQLINCVVSKYTRLMSFVDLLCKPRLPLSSWTKNELKKLAHTHRSRATQDTT